MIGIINLTIPNLRAESDLRGAIPSQQPHATGGGGESVRRLRELCGTVTEICCSFVSGLSLTYCCQFKSSVVVGTMKPGVGWYCNLWVNSLKKRRYIGASGDPRQLSDR